MQLNFVFEILSLKSREIAFIRSIYVVSVNTFGAILPYSYDEETKISLIYAQKTKLFTISEYSIYSKIVLTMFRVEFKLL